MNPSIFTQSFRTLGVRSLLRSSLTKNSGALSSILLKNAQQKRNTTTTKSTTTEHEQLLSSQRSLRPLAPHFTIYQPQLTWFMSLAHRVTGAGLGVVLYGGASVYALNIFQDSDTLVATIATLPTSIKLAGKFILAYPFSFHLFNGIRHLIWDTGYALTIKGVYATGWSVIGLSTISTVLLCLL